jgi:methyltransferase
VIPVLALGAALLLMRLEQRRSQQHERALRARSATEPPGDVYRAMAVIYPLSFVAMAFEAWWRAGAGGAPLAGLALFAGAKALKYWAIAALGDRWTFRVLVPPGSRTVSSGPYRWVRHPNYIAVIGELLGFAVMVGAPGAGIPSILVFARLIQQRVRVEEQALRGT